MKNKKYNEEKNEFIIIKKSELKIKEKTNFDKWKILSITILIFFFFEIFVLIKKIVNLRFNSPIKRKFSESKKNKSIIQTINITNTKPNNTYNNNTILNDSSIYNTTNKLNDTVFSKEELKYHSVLNALLRSKNFVNKSADGILLNNNSIILNENPKISVVIPVYNCEKTIKRAIRSIQNQNFSDFEIILVNDLSNDNSLEIINNLRKNDPRIKIFNNHKNMGTLYTRSIGALYSNGKYIFPLDNDDMFLEKDVFYSVAIETAEKNDFDIVEFRAIETHGLRNFFKNNVSPSLLNKHKKGRIVYQPQLSGYPLRPAIRLSHYHMSDVYIWGKCIKTEIYKKAVMSYGEEKYSNYVTTFEDLIINFMIFQFAKSFIFIPKYGILRIMSGSSAYLHTSQIASNKYEMRLLDAVVDFSRNTFEGKKIVVNIAVKFLGNYALDLTLQKEKYKILLKSILERIFKCPYITDEDKQIIKEKSLRFKLFNEAKTK